ncbi:MAG: hypothetical protein KA513_04380 [Flavobacterium sp.]|jgi:hypothetical protein|uniref:hypothetical protein n=1 Tax=Flavobacterium sp. TaxID=239 RepID=UPI001B772620|nr:hypothetical protein [Flavobacterium sp.]MBP6073837.1 hypothetical protein [Flavobacterium sp.]
MKAILFVILSLFANFLFAQGIERKVLRGIVVVDSFDVEAVTVRNISSNLNAKTDIDGKFSIRARATDTLFFESQSFISQRYILSQKDFWKEELEIRLHVKITELDELIITPYTLSGNLTEDTKRIQVYGDGFALIDAKKIMHYEDDVRMGAPINTAMPNVFAPTGVNLLGIVVVGLVNLVGVKANPKKNSERVFEERRIKNLQSKSYSDHLFERFSHSFFVETLKIKNEDIPLFMGFSELNVYDLSPLLKPENELKLIDYLIQKAAEFKKQNQKE